MTRTWVNKTKAAAADIDNDNDDGDELVVGVGGRREKVSEKWWRLWTFGAGAGDEEKGY